MKAFLVAGLFLFLFLAGCTNSTLGNNATPTENKLSGNPTPPEANECYDCRIACPGAASTKCVNEKCVCTYDTQQNENQNTNTTPIQNEPTNPTKPPANIPTTTSFIDTLPSCGTKMDYWSVLPLNEGDFAVVVPLGNLNPPAHTFPTDHMYMLIDGEYEYGTPTEKVSLYIPADAWITEVTTTKYLSKNPLVSDYSFVFHPCKELSFKFGHVSSFTSDILSQISAQEQCNPSYETGGETYQQCSSTNLSIQVSAGQKVGTAGGNVNQNGFDLWAYDERSPPSVDANPARWYDAHRKITCPMDYFTLVEKQKLYPYLKGTNGVKRTIEPLCGTIQQDILGTAQGIWFVAGTINTYPEDPHMALALDNANPLMNVFSIGNSIPNLNAGKYSFTPETSGKTNRAFADVKPGSIYCFEPDGENFTIMVELTSESTLKIEKKSNGTCSGTVAFSNAVVFER